LLIKYKAVKGEKLIGVVQILPLT